MKTTIFKISIILLFLSLMGAGCEKEEELPPNHAKGKIILVTVQCYGETVLIEVENPKGIGKSGTFSYMGKENKKISYQNAIGIPYFSKNELPSNIPQKVGTWLYFEYRELTDDETKNGDLYSPNPPIACLSIYGDPTRKNLIITKVIEFK